MIHLEKQTSVRGQSSVASWRDRKNRIRSVEKVRDMIQRPEFQLARLVGLKMRLQIVSLLQFIRSRRSSRNQTNGGRLCKRDVSRAANLPETEFNRRSTILCVISDYVQEEEIGVEQQALPIDVGFVDALSNGRCDDLFHDVFL